MWTLTRQLSTRLGPRGVAAIAHVDAVFAGVADLGQLGAGRLVPVREVLVHMIREYAQHLGHADLLRERIGGRIGQ